MSLGRYNRVARGHPLTPQQANIAREHGQFLDVFPIGKGGFSLLPWVLQSYTSWGCSFIPIRTGLTNILNSFFRPFCFGPPFLWRENPSPSPQSVFWGLPPGHVWERTDSTLAGPIGLVHHAHREGRQHLPPGPAPGVSAPGPQARSVWERTVGLQSNA